MLVLSHLIRRAIEYNGIITAYVYGEFGYGKTSYALWVAYEVYNSWKEALEHLYFKPHEVIEVLGEALDTGKRIPLIVMDDAGLWLDRLTWWETDKVRFMELFNLIRSLSSGVIFTTPSEELPTPILNKCFFRVKVDIIDPENAPRHDVERVLDKARRYNLKPLVSKATGYRLKTLPSFFKLVKKTYYDYFPTHYPVYEDYERKRKEALKYYYRRLREVVEEPTGEDVQKLIYKRLTQGKRTSEIVKELRSMGIPRSTAYYYVKKIREALTT